MAISLRQTRRLNGRLIAVLGVALVIVACLATSHFSANASVSTSIYNVQPVTVSSQSVDVSWHTDARTDAKIEYGPTTSYGTTASSATLANDHTLTLQNLVAGTTYHYRVGNTDGSMVSADYTVVTPYNFGVLKGSTDSTINSAQLSTEYQSGVRNKTLELAWDSYEPGNNSFSSTYINAKKAELAAYLAQGFNVTLDLGSQYAPTWVTSLDSNALYKNQYGDTYAPNSPGKNVANGVFSNSVRTAMSNYVSSVFTNLGDNFYAVRAGAGYYGELHYPEATYNSRPNSFWGYNPSAQTGTGLPAGIPVNPVPGWIPNPVNNGTFENGDDGSYILSGTDSIITTGAHRGTRALQKVNPGAWSNETSQSNIPVVSGQTYTYSVWAKSTNGSAPACIQIRRPNGTEITISCTGSSTYAELTGTFTALDPTVTVALVTYDGSATTLTYDDLSITASGYTDDATHANATSFLNWYQNALINFQNWQITQYRNAGYTGKIFMMYPGYGVRDDASVNQSTDAISYDLSYTRGASKSGELQQMTDWKPEIVALPADTSVYAYSTWIDGTGTDSSTDKGLWSPAKYLSYAASGTNHGLYGENTGNNSYTQMQTALTNMQLYGYQGIFWFDQAQLNSGTYASLANYKTQIAAYDHTAPYQASLAINGNATVTTSRQVTLDLAAVDNVTDSADLQMRISESPTFSGAAYVPYTATASFALSDSYGEKTIYISFKDQAGNESEPYRASIDYPAPADQTAPPTTGSGTVKTTTHTTSVSSDSTVATDTSTPTDDQSPPPASGTDDANNTGNPSDQTTHQSDKKGSSYTLVKVGAGIVGLLLVGILLRTYLLFKRK